MTLLATLTLTYTVLTGEQLRVIVPMESPPAVLLREEVKPEEWRGYEVNTLVEGELRGEAEGKSLPIRIRGVGKHKLAERILSSSAGEIPNRTIRSYTHASVEVHVAGERLIKTLRPERSCIIYGRLPDGTRGFCPHGALTRDELDIVTEHWPTATLPSMLPGKVVAVGQTWKISPTIICEVCLLDAVLECQVEGKLLSLQGAIAEFAVRGKVVGIDKGAKVNLVFDSKGQYDQRSGRVVEYQWNQEDERTAGWWSPASRLRIRVTVQRLDANVQTEACSQPHVLEPQLWQQPKAELLQLEGEGPRKSYRLRYNREWYIVGQTEDHLMMRLVDRGDTLAQLTLTHWRQANDNQSEQIAEFRKAVAATPGWKPDKLLSEGEIDINGFHAFRIIQQGKVGNQPMIRRFWLIRFPSREQLVVTVSLPPENQQRFGDKDVELIKNLTFLPPR